MVCLTRELALHKRIARTLFGFLCATVLICAVCAALLVKASQDHLLEDMMADLMDGAVMQLNRMDGMRLPPGTYLWSDDPRAAPIPQALAASCVVSRGMMTDQEGLQGRYADLFLYHSRQNGFSYILGREKRSYDLLENRYWLWIAAVAVTFLILAWFASCRLANYFVSPLAALIEKLNHLQNDHFEPIELNASQLRIHEVQVLQERLNETYARLYAALERERQFTSDIGHELNTPLSVIETSLELMKAKATLPHQEKPLARAMHAAQEMNNLVSCFLEFSQSNVNLGASTPDTVARMLDHLIELWQPRAALKNIELIYQSKAPCLGSFSPTLVGVVLGNLIKNAVTYTDQGSVRVIESAQGVTIEDTGPGLPKEVLNQVWDRLPKRLAHLSLDALRDASHGIGLNLVYRVAARCGWRIVAENLKNEAGEVVGTRFQVILLSSQAAEGAMHMDLEGA